MRTGIMPTHAILPSPDAQTLDIHVQNLDQVGAFEIEMLLDPKTSSIRNVELGAALQGQRQWLALPLRNDAHTDKAIFGAVSLGNNAPALSGAGNIAKVNLASLGSSAAKAQVLKITLFDSEGNVMTRITPNQAAVK